MLGLVTGVVLVFGCFVENENATSFIKIGWLPDSAQALDLAQSISVELEGDGFLDKVRHRLGAGTGNLVEPKWWMRRQFRIEFGAGGLRVETRHPSLERASEMASAFEEEGNELSGDLYEPIRRSTLEKVERRLREIEEELRVAASFSDDRAYDETWERLLPERVRLEGDRILLGGDPEADKEIRTSYSIGCAFGSYCLPPWWQDPPPWSLFLARCTGYGLLAAFPAVFLLELVRPRR